ncbi:MAG: hypothetical protein KA144_09735 [Xanthomonadaceae bacterium]|nr:hypothetical protein [Xanthomonadaceae bacterium]
MTLLGKTEEEIRALQDQLVAALRELGGYSGNISLQRTLGWDDKLYWPLRDRLVDSGHLKRQRARGGAVQLVGPGSAAQSPDEIKLIANQKAESEGELYAPVASVLQGDWARDNRFRQHLVEVTAFQGRRNTGGTWTRPDLVVAAVRLFQFLPGKYFDLITFEIKPRWAVTVTAIYEALAHRRSATQSIAWFHCPLEDQSSQKENLDRIAEEAERHGIGMIIAATPSDYSTWETRIEPARIEPDPEHLNEFIALQFSDGAKDELTAWVR